VNRLTLGCVVEGHGDEKALPVLLRKIVADLRPEVLVEVPEPVRCPRENLFREPDLRRALRFAAARLHGPSGLLVLFDADDDCPVEKAEKVVRLCPDLDYRVVVANREYEAWFLASIRSMRGHPLIRPDAEPSPDPEKIRGAKEAFRGLMTVPYSETIHQAKFTALMDMGEAAGCRSFRKLVADVRCMLENV
jgi:hypothetical protein